MATKPIPFGRYSFARAMRRASYPCEKGQVLQVKITAVPFAPFSDSREWVSPSVPLSAKLGPRAPRASSSCAVPAAGAAGRAAGGAAGLVPGAAPRTSRATGRTRTRAARVVRVLDEQGRVLMLGPPWP